MAKASNQPRSPSIQITSRISTYSSRSRILQKEGKGQHKTTDVDTKNDRSATEPLAAAPSRSHWNHKTRYRNPLHVTIKAPTTFAKHLLTHSSRRQGLCCCPTDNRFLTGKPRTQKKTAHHPMRIYSKTGQATCNSTSPLVYDCRMWNKCPQIDKINCQLPIDGKSWIHLRSCPSPPLLLAAERAHTT